MQFDWCQLLRKRPFLCYFAAVATKFNFKELNWFFLWFLLFCVLANGSPICSSRLPQSNLMFGLNLGRITKAFQKWVDTRKFSRQKASDQFKIDILREQDESYCKTFKIETEIRKNVSRKSRPRPCLEALSHGIMLQKYSSFQYGLLQSVGCIQCSSFGIPQSCPFAMRQSRPIILLRIIIKTETGNCGTIWLFNEIQHTPIGLRNC